MIVVILVMSIITFIILVVSYATRTNNTGKVWIISIALLILIWCTIEFFTEFSNIFIFFEARWFLSSLTLGSLSFFTLLLIDFKIRKKRAKMLANETADERQIREEKEAKVRDPAQEKLQQRIVQFHLDNDIKQSNIAKYNIPNRVLSNNEKYILGVEYLDNPLTSYVKYIKGNPLFPNPLGFYIWVDDEVLNLVHDNLYNCQGALKIPLGNIRCFMRQGDIYTETQITSGGGGGSSITGAVIGGVIAGPAGAIIGSRKANESFKTVNKAIDKRRTILEFKLDNELNYMFFGSNAYNTFLDIIPMKEVNFVTNENKNKDDSAIYDKLRELAKLKDEGILSEDEFTKKKNDLLEKM